MSRILLLVIRLLRTAADDLDFVRLNRVAIVVELESDIADEESPNLIAEAVGVERALSHPQS